MDNLEKPRQGTPKGGKQEVLAREAEILKLRRGGLTYDLIAERLGYSSAQTVRNAYERALTRITSDEVTELRRLSNDRLDIALAAIWGNVLKGDNSAISNFIRIEERRAKLNGLDQPTRIQAEVVTYDANSVRAELARLLTQRSDSVPTLQVGTNSSESEPTTT